ncbi:MAG TPA: M15 family metallopeptidase, partial [Thermoanaerobaculia bacterium]
VWDVHHRASDTLAEYLRLADEGGGAKLQSLVTKAQANGDSKTLAWWKNRLTTDRAMLPHWDFQHHKRPEKSGYMDLPRDVVVALVGAGLLWGGQYRTGKDIMHFDLRNGPIRKR